VEHRRRFISGRIESTARCDWGTAIKIASYAVEQQGPQKLEKRLKPLTNLPVAIRIRMMRYDGHSVR